MTREYCKTNCEKGVAIIEMTFFLSLLVVLLGAAVELGLLLVTNYQSENAAREAARLAVTVYNLEAEDIRVVNWMKEKKLIDVPSIYASGIELSVSAPAPVSLTPGKFSVCQDVVTARAQSEFTFRILGLIGFDTLDINKVATMRYQWQELCPTP